MSLIVQKFGGTSVADAERINRVADRIIRAKLDGSNVVVVCSARGKTTDELIALAAEITPDPPRRELDMLVATGEQVSIALVAMAIHAKGHSAISLNAAQIGIRTDNAHTKAKIIDIDTDRVRRELLQGNIVIVAGFQGIDPADNITTLGRGGSDTSAVALAAALGADRCEIYTDVDGVYSADPRIVTDARKLETINYDEMLELASVGAGVLQSRSVEFAKKYGVPTCVRSSFSDADGTLLIPDAPYMEDVVVRGLALNTGEAKVTIRNVPNTPGVAARLLRSIFDRNINVDMVVQNVGQEGHSDLSFTVMETDLAETLEVARAVRHDAGAGEVSSDANIAKLSAVGMGMRTHSGVALMLFDALAREGINIQMVSASDIKISCVIDQDLAHEALRAVHAAFGLEAERGQT